MIAVSSSESIGRTPRLRQASEQWRTSSHERSHFLRQRIVRPQTTQFFAAGSGITGKLPRLRPKTQPGERVTVIVESLPSPPEREHLNPPVVVQA